jgi:adenylyltransferase/sulfurtransferase
VQAVETIKLILGAGKPLIGRMIHFDTMSMEVRVLKLRRDPNCLVCGDNPQITDLIDYEEFCSLAGGNGDRPHAAETSHAAAANA